MSRLSRIILGYLVSFLFIVIPAKAQKEAEVYNVDSSLYAYYQRCQEHLLEPVVLSMSDTLFRMASGQNDQRMQAVALSTRLDYYYYQANNEDSIIFYTNKVKQLPLLLHYLPILHKLHYSRAHHFPGSKSADIRQIQPELQLQSILQLAYERNP